MKRPIPDDAAVAVIDIEHWSKTQIDAVSAKFGREHITYALREPLRRAC